VGSKREIMKKIWLFILLLCLVSPLAAKKNVLIIESYHSEFSWDQSYIKGIKSVLQDDFELSYFQMDTKRLPKTAYQERANKAWQYAQQIKPDLVILGDDNALQYLGVRFSQTDIPVIYLGINNNPRNYHVYKSKNITGVLERPLIKRAIPAITKLLTNKVNNVLLMFDNSQTSRIILEEIFANKTQMTISAIKVDIKLIEDWNMWKNELLMAKNNGYDAVFLGLFQTLQGNTGEPVGEDIVLKWSSENTSVPPFAFWDFAVGKGKAIGGLVSFGYEQGRLVGEIAEEILINNKKPYQVGRKTAEKGGYLFSRTELQKYDIKLPAKLVEKSILID
jgi:ABC-type uncharacterized transport system substrate-binding protein